MAIFQKTIQGLINDVTYYTRVFPINPKGAVQSELGGQWASCVPMAFPANPPTAYELIDTYGATTFTAPEPGYYKIELYGASGNGGTAWHSAELDSDTEEYWIRRVSGSGGGSGGLAISYVKLNVGDTIVTTAFGVGSTAAVYINSTIEVYSNMLVSSGGNAKNCTSYTTVAAGAGGIASGGDENYNGNSGAIGNRSAGWYPGPQTIKGGAGGAAVKPGCNVGGAGGDFVMSSWNTFINKAPGSGSPAFMKIYRGNTNRA